MNDEARAQLLKIRLLGGSEDDQADWLVWYNHQGAPEDEPKIGEDTFAKLTRAVAGRTRGQNSGPTPATPLHQASQPEVP